MTKHLVPRLVDSHCHLDFPEFDNDIDNIISRAKNAGISTILTICTKPKDLNKVIKIVESQSLVYFAAGSHPLNKEHSDKFTKDKLLQLSQNPKMVGIGETGLDYFYSSENSDDQKKHFRLHIAVARECSLPLIVHSRSADTDMASILREEYKIGPFECVMHCFSSGSELAKIAIDLGFYLSISGITVFPKSDHLRNIFSSVPVNRLLVETDSPYLAPPPFRGKRNEPSYVALIAKKMSDYLAISEDDFRKITSENFYRLFKKVKL